jgi:hypothetical protein
VDSVLNSATANWDSHLSVASTDWSVSGVLDTNIVTGDISSDTRKKCPAVLGQIRVCNASYGFNGWLGQARIWASGNHITQGTAKMNDSYLDNPKFITPYETGAWRQLVLCQEVGHPFGLAHQDEIFDNPNLGTCMDYTNNPSGPPSNEHPNAHDYAQLGSIYAHLDSTTTIGQTLPPSAGKGSADNGQDDWGRAIRKDAQGRPNLFEKDLGGSDKVFTWVFWTASGKP